MTSPDVAEGNCLGQFSCDLNMLARLLGFPEGVSIKHIEMAPYIMCNQHAVRFVVEDEENFPSLKDGQELTAVSPQFRLGAGSYREFTGWNTNVHPIVPSESSTDEDDADGI